MKLTSTWSIMASGMGVKVWDESAEKQEYQRNIVAFEKFKSKTSKTDQEKYLLKMVKNAYK